MGIDPLPAAPGALPSPVGPAPGRDVRLGVWCVLALVLLAVIPSLGTLDAPLLADDAAILGFVEREGALGDWFGPQYGLQLVAFWRPVVTGSWWVQEAISGDAVLPLRGFNLLCHVLSVLALAAIARRIGCSKIGALAAGGLAAFFPEQGGTVTWVAGRVDSLCLPPLLFACVLALDRRYLLAAGMAFVACATKEIGFLVPGWVFLLTWARGDRFGEILRAFLPVLIAASIALVWRWLALETLVGGYLAAPRLDVAAIPEALATWGRASALLAVGGLAALVAGAVAGTWQPRIVGAAALCAFAGALPILQILQAGGLPEQNLRLLCVSDLGLCLLAGAALGGRGPWGRRAVLPALVLLLVGGWRAGLAFSDTHEWAEAGRVAERACDRARLEVASDPASPHPVLYDGFPPLYRGAYCLGFGVVDRFRAPFVVPPRPIWPLRPLFQGSRELVTVVPLRDGFVRPRIGGARPDAPIGWTSSERTSDGAVPVDMRIAAVGHDTSPRIIFTGGDRGTILVVVLYTEMGYESARWREAGEGRTHEISLRELAALNQGCVGTPGQVLLQTADLGATRAYLEVRALRSTDGSMMAASDWIPLVWDAGLHRTMGP